MSQMKSLYGKCRETLRKMQQKTRDCLEQRDDMRSRMDEALQAKEAVRVVTRASLLAAFIVIIMNGHFGILQ